tara:strand:- start:241898 stop:242980 length:1083 start_codon:yes stop_codon:yes gene_type:complete
MATLKLTLGKYNVNVAKVNEENFNDEFEHVVSQLFALAYKDHRDLFPGISNFGALNVLQVDAKQHLIAGDTYASSLKGLHIGLNYDDVKEVATATVFAKDFVHDYVVIEYVKGKGLRLVTSEDIGPLLYLYIAHGEVSQLYSAYFCNQCNEMRNQIPEYRNRPQFTYVPYDGTKDGGLFVVTKMTMLKLDKLLEYLNDEIVVKSPHLISGIATRCLIPIKDTPWLVPDPENKDMALATLHVSSTISSDAVDSSLPASSKARVRATGEVILSVIDGLHALFYKTIVSRLLEKDIYLDSDSVILNYDRETDRITYIIANVEFPSMTQNETKKIFDNAEKISVVHEDNGSRLFHIKGFMPCDS